MADARKPRRHSAARRGSATAVLQYDCTVVDAPAFAQLLVYLGPGQSIVADGGAMSYMREGVAKGRLDTSTGLSGMFNRAFAGEGIFQNVFERRADLAHATREAGLVAFASPFPGDILRLDLSPNETAVLSRGAYLASTPGVVLNARLNWRGIFVFGQQEGLVLPDLKLADGVLSGSAWMGAYGSFARHTLGAGQSMLVDNGMFLACIRPAEADASRPLYTVESLGRSTWSTMFGGEGLGMRFHGPCVLYTQSRNFNDLVAAVSQRLPPSRGGGSGKVCLAVKK